MRREERGGQKGRKKALIRGCAFRGQRDPAGSDLFQSQAQPPGSQLSQQLCGSPGLHNGLGSSLHNMPPTSMLWATGREPEKTVLNVRGTFWDLHSNLCFLAGQTSVSGVQSHSS